MRTHLAYAPLKGPCMRPHCNFGPSLAKEACHRKRAGPHPSASISGWRDSCAASAAILKVRRQLPLVLQRGLSKGLRTISCEAMSLSRSASSPIRGHTPCQSKDRAKPECVLIRATRFILLQTILHGEGEKTRSHNNVYLYTPILCL